MKPKVIIKLAVDVLIEKHEKGTENRCDYWFYSAFLLPNPCEVVAYAMHSSGKTSLAVGLSPYTFP